VGGAGVGWLATRTLEHEEIVAICDVDPVYAQAALQFKPNARFYYDFRLMFAEMGDAIDAVVISTPDHAHFPATALALSLGKHVYLEKPLAHRVEEIRLLQDMSGRSSGIAMMGIQGHSTPGVRSVKAWFDSGLLGEVREVHAWTDTPNPRWFLDEIPRFPLEEQPIPEKLDWDLWLGPAAYRPFNINYIRRKWRGWWDLGGGLVGDNSPHTFDAPFWAMGLGRPTRVEVNLEREPVVNYTTYVAQVTFHFPARDTHPPVKLFWYQGKPRAPEISSLPPDFPLESRGMVMVGSRDILYAPGLYASSPRLLGGTPETREMSRHFSDTFRVTKANHYLEWADTLRDNRPSSSDFRYGGALSELACLGALAISTGRSFEWDPITLTIPSHPGLSPLLRHHPREGWDFRSL
jgi:predicted dehydrogenase